MDIETKAKWTAALRSGVYEQGTGFLKSKDKFCCLGVLCDLNDPKEWVDETYHFQSMFLPASLMTKAGLTEQQSALLASMNDTGSTFEEIADLIESYYLGT